MDFKHRSSYAAGKTLVVQERSIQPGSYLSIPFLKIYFSFIVSWCGLKWTELRLASVRQLMQSFQDYQYGYFVGLFTFWFAEFALRSNCNTLALGNIYELISTTTCHEIIISYVCKRRRSASCLYNVKAFSTISVRKQLVHGMVYSTLICAFCPLFVPLAPCGRSSSADYSTQHCPLSDVLTWN